MLNRIRLAPIIALLAALFVAPGVSASIQSGDIVSFGNGPGSPGGIFYLKDDSGNKIADTFCVQLEEYISFSKTYQVYSITTSTILAGSRDLTPLAAWLFDRYLNGVEGVGPALSNFNFDNTYGQQDPNAALIQANKLQTAIWSAIGYTAAQIGNGYYTSYSGNIAGWEAEFQSDVDNGLWSGTGNIYVLNLLGKDGSGNYTVHSQDQLVRIIPEPMSAVVWSVLIGAVGAAQLRRRR